MSTAAIASFWAVSMLFVLTPGADWAFAIAAGLRRRAVFWSVTGMLTGHLIATLLVVAGLATLLAATPAVLVALTAAGGLYLTWLGITTLRRRRDTLAAPVRTATGSQGFLSGIGVSLLNPKVFLLFLALLPQFVTPDTNWPPTAQLLALGAIHVGNCAIIYYAVGFGAGKVLTGRPRATTFVTTISGIALVGLGAALLTEQLIPRIT